MCKNKGAFLNACKKKKKLKKGIEKGIEFNHFVDCLIYFLYSECVCGEQWSLGAFLCKN